MLRGAEHGAQLRVGAAGHDEQVVAEHLGHGQAAGFQVGPDGLHIGVALAVTGGELRRRHELMEVRAALVDGGGDEGLQVVEVVGLERDGHVQHVAGGRHAVVHGQGLRSDRLGQIAGLRAAGKEGRGSSQGQGIHRKFHENLQNCWCVDICLDVSK